MPASERYHDPVLWWFDWRHLWASIALLMATAPEPPYPWCKGNPTREDCIRDGYCRRNPNCGD